MGSLSGNEGWTRGCLSSLPVHIFFLQSWDSHSHSREDGQSSWKKSLLSTCCAPSLGSALNSHTRKALACSQGGLTAEFLMRFPSVAPVSAAKWEALRSSLDIRRSWFLEGEAWDQGPLLDRGLLDRRAPQFWEVMEVFLPRHPLLVLGLASPACSVLVCPSHSPTRCQL